MGLEGLKLLAAAGKKYNLITVTEVLDAASIKTAAQGYPQNATIRGRMPVRNTMVLVETMKTPAIFMAKIFKNEPPNCRAT